MAEEDKARARDSELVLAPGVYALVMDQTKGKVGTFSGPLKMSLSNTDQLVVNKDGFFVPSTQTQAIQRFVSVPKGSYVVLENPHKEGRQPDAGKQEDSQPGSLRYGCKVNLPGPQSFPLWPEQKATVLGGHHLRSNQYLLVRVYDDEEAKANWDKSVVKTVSAGVEQDASKSKSGKPGKETASSSDSEVGILPGKDSLATGQLLVVKGTNVSFYIPPTGIEVVPDDSGKYVRDAVTLERLEYSILLDEDGNKEYVKGPDVVFPKPTQTFRIGDDGARKYRAFELQEKTGLHLKVIADYTEDGKSYKAGDELFITGKDMPIYYPRPEHAIIRYNDHDKYFATAVPAGEGRYVLNRESGVIRLVKGPDMFLPNPIEEVMVRRILSDKECELYFPGNEEALTVNRTYREEAQAPRARMVGSALESMPMAHAQAFSLQAGTPVPGAASPMMADAITRSQRYTKPRTVTINSKYEGAIRINVWSGYAVQVVNSRGERKVVEGPASLLLEYDETLERLELSKGRPKNPNQRKSTVYLKHAGNGVRDLLTLKTQDLVDVELEVKYLVRFRDSHKDKWFAVDNYVQHMCDHLRSKVGNVVRRMGVQAFHSNATDTLRDIVLGTKDKDGNRSPWFCDDDGLEIYDVEVTNVTIKDIKINNLLTSAKQEALAEQIELERQNQKLALTKGVEEAKRNIMLETDKSLALRDELQAKSAARADNNDLEEARREALIKEAKKQGERTAAEVEAETEAIERESARLNKELEKLFAEADLDRAVRKLAAEADSTEKRLKAVQPGLVEALIAASTTSVLKDVVPQMGALAFTNNQDLETTLNTMVKGTAAEDLIKNLKNLSHRPQNNGPIPTA